VLHCTEATTIRANPGHAHTQYCLTT